MWKTGYEKTISQESGRKAHGNSALQEFTEEPEEETVTGRTPGDCQNTQGQSEHMKEYSRGQMPVQ